MTFTCALLSGVCAAIAATTALGFMLEAATRPSPAPKGAGEPRPKAAFSVAPPEPITPKVIKTEAFRSRPSPAAVVTEPPKAPSPPVALVPIPDQKTAVPPHAPIRVIPRAPQERGVCERHNLRKVYTRSGRSWRCRR